MFVPSWILIVGVGIIVYVLWRNRFTALLWLCRCSPWISAIAYVLWHNRFTALPQKPQLNPGKIPISPEVDSKEFSSLFAETLLDKQASPIFLLLFQSGNGYITWREIMFMKFLLGKIDRDTMIEEMEAHKNDSYQDAQVINRQVKILTSKFKTEGRE